MENMWCFTGLVYALLYELTWNGKSPGTERDEHPCPPTKRLQLARGKAQSRTVEAQLCRDDRLVTDIPEYPAPPVLCFFMCLAPSTLPSFGPRPCASRGSTNQTAAGR